MDNVVAEAIRRLGGVTAAVVATGISTATWHRYRLKGRIPDVELLFRVADMTGLEARALAGVPPPSDHPEPPASSPAPTTAGSTRAARRLPKRRSDEPRVYGTIRPRREDRNNCPLLMLAA